MDATTSETLSEDDLLFWEFGEDWRTPAQKAEHDRRMRAEKDLILGAIENAFVICDREVNFCLNNDVISRNILFTEMLFACGNWSGTYADEGVELFGAPETGADRLGRMGDFLSVFAPAYLRSLIATIFDAPEGVAKHILPADADEMGMLTDEQVAIIEDLSYEFHNPQHPVCDPHLLLGRAAACAIASEVMACEGDGDAFLSNLIRLDSEGVPVFAIAGLAAAQAASCAYVMMDELDDPDGTWPIETPLTPPSMVPALVASFYDMVDGKTDRGTSAPSLTTPAGIVDALRRDMTEEGIRYFASLPFRRGYEWIDRKNSIIVPNKSDEFLLDHLLRKGVLMPFAERAFWACARKDSYETYEDARRHADAYERKDGRKKAVYRCPFCGKFHITKNLRYDDSRNAGEQKRLLRMLGWHGINSTELLLSLGRDFLERNRERIIRRVRERWNRMYGASGRGSYGSHVMRRAA